eukprot:s735_g8.t1
MSEHLSNGGSYFLEWLKEVDPADRQWYKDRFKEMCFRLDGNLYGRRTAGSVYRNELEEIVCSRVDPQRYAFVRAQKDPCIFRCTKTGIVLLHHVDDIRAAGPSEALAVHLPVHKDRHRTAAPCGRHPRSRTFRGPGTSL